MDCKFLYVMGSESGIGKSTVCLGLLAQLLAEGFKPSELAYIKPMTQCVTPQLVAQFCMQTKIAYQATEGLVFTKDFTRDFINGLTKDSTSLLDDILADIQNISIDKKLVVIDGVGAPSVGGVIGVSNVDIALALKSQVLFVEKFGLGSAIDSTLLCTSFMHSQGLKEIGLIYNNLRASEHNENQILLAKRLSELLPECPLLGFVNHNERLAMWVQQENVYQIAQWFTHFINMKLLLKYALTDVP
jgi:dethiobiotin synthetase